MTGLDRGALCITFTKDGEESSTFLPVIRRINSCRTPPKRTLVTRCAFAWATVILAQEGQLHGSKSDYCRYCSCKPKMEDSSRNLLQQESNIE